MYFRIKKPGSLLKSFNKFRIRFIRTEVFGLNVLPVCDAEELASLVNPLFDCEEYVARPHEEFAGSADKLDVVDLCDSLYFHISSS